MLAKPHSEYGGRSTSNTRRRRRQNTCCGTAW